MISKEPDARCSHYLSQVMGNLYNKVRKSKSSVTHILIITLVILQAYHVMADKHTDTQDTLKHNRRRRQAGDMLLMQYNAQKALKGTTRPSDFFQRIGKKWAAASGLNSDVWVRRRNLGNGLYMEPEEIVENW